jgi:hypothetical protein
MCERYDLVGLTNHSLDILKKYENEWIAMGTAHNRIVYASGLKPLGFRSPRSFHSHGSLHHIFAVAETLRVSLSQPQKRRIQPKRYA